MKIAVIILIIWIVWISLEAWKDKRIDKILQKQAAWDEGIQDWARKTEEELVELREKNKELEERIEELEKQDFS